MFDKNNTRSYIKFCIFSSVFFASFLFADPVYAKTVSISFFPSEVAQGEPLMIQVDTSPKNLKRITFGGVPVRVFTYKDKPTGIVGLELNKQTGIYYVSAELTDGTVLWKSIEVKKKNIRLAPYTIPKKLGGNTPQGQKDLVDSLKEENNAFKYIKTGTKTWWLTGFISPLKEKKVNDEFGYYRQLGSMIMAHKGVDYFAPEGTEVVSTNDGIVRVVGEYRNYGNTVIVDHGLGVLSFYLHLSDTKVKKGQFVYKGQIIGSSGDTGYADYPHLHFSIRIYGVSVDPEKFLELYK